jgi:CysZ protein
MSINPVGGLGYVLKGLGLITRPGLRRFVIIPLLINIVVFGIGLWLAYDQIGGLSTWVQAYLPSWLDWLTTLLLPLFMLVALVVIFFGFSIIANLIASPFNGLLAEKVEELLTGKPLPDSGWGKRAAELPGTLGDEVNKLLYSLVWAIPFLLLFVIPVVNIAAPFLWLAFSAWIMAVQYADYPMGNHGLKGREMRRRLGRKRITSLSFGGGVLALTSIPVVNFIAMPVAVCGATAYWVGKLSELDAPG